MMPFENWKQFKAIEKKWLPNKLRTISSYSDNYSPSLFWSCSTKKLSELNNQYDELLNLCQNEVVDHAALRVDLLFYKFLAYYKTKLAPISGFTSLQHGKGRKNIFDQKVLTHAAHHSMTPSSIDKTICHETPMVSCIKNSQLKIQTSILSGTYFMDSLNSTFELPVFVNEFDYLLEFTHGGREKSFKILREVALGIITPIQGLLQFLNLLKDIFTYMEADKNVFTINTPLTKETKIKLLALQKTGSLLNKLNEQNRVNPNYINMLLRINHLPHDYHKTHPDLYESIIMEKMQEIQTEILTTPSLHMKP